MHKIKKVNTLTTLKTSKYYDHSAQGKPPIPTEDDL